MNKLGKFAAACAVVLCAFCAMAATTYIWTGEGEPNPDGSLNWSNPTNWGKTADSCS